MTFGRNIQNTLENACFRVGLLFYQLLVFQTL